MVEPVQVGSFESAFFPGEVNRFVGSGGEVLVKGEGNSEETTIEVGDQLVGIGVTHLVETLDRPPGLDTFHAFGVHDVRHPLTKKVAMRGFEVVFKEGGEGGYDFGFAPLAPDRYAALVERVSGGAVSIPPETIPEGTMVVSFLDPDPAYTLAAVKGSPGANWAAAAKGARHWNVGIGDPSDFWAASFPSDDVGVLATVPPSVSFGTIRFGLSLLSGESGFTTFERVPFPDPAREATSHQFCLLGEAVGTAGLDTPFPIGLRTKITFKPVRTPALAQA